MTDPNELSAWEYQVAQLHLAGEQEAAIAAFFARIEDIQPLRNPEFDRMYEHGLRRTASNPVPLRRRARFESLLQLLSTTPAARGPVVECGCFRGLSSYLLCCALRNEDPAFDGRGYHVFDSFQGLSEPTSDDDVPDNWSNAVALRAMTRTGAFASPLETVRANLHEFPAITYHPGWLPLTFKGLREQRYRFVHVDVDLYDPTLDCLHYFYPRLLPGGRLVSDDYSWPGARTAIDEYCRDCGIEVTANAHQQAVITQPI